MSDDIQKYDIFEKSSETLSKSDQYYIFRLLILAKIKLTGLIVLYESKKYTGIIYNLNIVNFTINIFNFKIQNSRKIILIFENSNSYYKLESNIVSFKDNYLTIKLPNQIYFLERRKFIRINFIDLFASFTLLDNKIYKSKEKDLQIEAIFNFLFLKIAQENPNTKDIIYITLSEISKMQVGIKFYDLNNKPKHYEILNQIFEATSKSIAIFDVNKIEAFTQKKENDFLTNFYTFIQEQSNKQNQVEISNIISEIKLNKINLDYNSFLISPLKSLNQTIGYIEIFNSQFGFTKMSYNVAIASHNLIKILNYGISKILINKEYYNNNNKQMARVLNLSLTGMLIEIYNEEVFEYLKFFRRIKIKMNLFLESIILNGEILRFEKKENKYFLGVQIFHLPKNHMQILEEFLYDSGNHTYF